MSAEKKPVYASYVASGRHLIKPALIDGKTRPVPCWLVTGNSATPTRALITTRGRVYRKVCTVHPETPTSPKRVLMAGGGDHFFIDYADARRWLIDKAARDAKWSAESFQRSKARLAARRKIPTRAPKS